MPKKGILVLFALLTTGFIGCRPCKYGDENLVEVPWSDIRNEIAKFICVETYPHEDGTVGYGFNRGTRERCVDEETSSPLSHAVETALEEARPLLVGILPEHTGFIHNDTLPMEASNVALQEAYLSSDMFLRPVLRELPGSLARNCLACYDLPALESQPVRSVSWSEFRRYLSAYAWPDEARPDVDDDGNPTGKTVFSFHVCVGINGINEMIDNPDSSLVYAAYSVAINSQDFFDLASDHFGDIIHSDSVEHMTSDSAKTEHLRRELPRRVTADKKLPPIACQFLKEHFDVLRIELDQCSGGSR